MAFLRIANELCNAFNVQFPVEFATARDSSVLLQLCRLQLPGVADIGLHDVAAIRQDDAFATFRLDMRNATADAEPDLVEGRLGAAQDLVSDHMRDALSRLDLNTRRGILEDVVISDLVGWGFGATAAGAIAGWQAAAATLLGKGIAELARKAPPKSERALRRHYVALADKRAAITQQDNRDVLRDETVFFMRNDVRHETRRQEQRRSAMNGILKSIDDWE
jgi:hypothetical protein